MTKEEQAALRVLPAQIQLMIQTAPSPEELARALRSLRYLLSTTQELTLTRGLRSVAGVLGLRVGFMGLSQCITSTTCSPPSRVTVIAANDSPQPLQ